MQVYTNALCSLSEERYLLTQIQIFTVTDAELQTDMKIIKPLCGIITVNKTGTMLVLKRLDVVMYPFLEANVSGKLVAACSQVLPTELT